MLWKVIGGVYAGLLVVSLIVGLVTPNYWGVDLGWLMVSLLGIYTIASLRKVNKDEIGGLIFFGKPLRQIGPGLHFAPWGLFYIETVPSTAIDIVIPGPSDKAYRGEDIPPAGMFVPVRVTFKKEDGSNDSLSQRVTAEVYFFVRMKIKDVLKFWPNIGDVGELRKEISSTVIGAATAVLTQMTVAQALASFPKINQDIRKAIEALVGEKSDDPNSWGIDLITSQTTAIVFNHDLNAALTGLPEKTLEALAMVKTAEGEKEKRRLEGEGTAAAAKAMLDAEAAGLKKKADDLGMSGEALVMYQMMQEGLQAGQVIISGSDGIANILRMGEAILGSKPKEKS